MQPDGVHLWYFKLSWCDLKSVTMGCKDTGIRKSKFVAKTQFLYSEKNKKDEKIKRSSKLRINIFKSGKKS